MYQANWIEKRGELIILNLKINVKCYYYTSGFNVKKILIYEKIKFQNLSVYMIQVYINRMLYKLDLILLLEIFF